MWEMACSEEHLQRHVVSVKAMKERMEDAEVCFSDQVPWWALLCRPKQLFLESELQRRPRSKRAGGAEGASGASAGAAPFAQLRGWDNQEAMKFRITVELRQVIHHYFKIEDNLVGVLETLVTVPGTHCRLNNISPEGKWLKDEKFYVGKTLKFHEAGNSVGNIMQAWRDLREQRQSSLKASQ
jgi:hypothetical protein